MKKLVYSLVFLSLVACGNNQAGKDGSSCTVVTDADGTATIKCTDGSSFNIVNGKDGQPGDAGSDGEKGQNSQSCNLVENSNGSIAVVCPADGTSYIVRDTTDNYCKKGFWGKNCENECNCQNDGICNDGVTGDGSCSCKGGWSDDDCSVCPANWDIGEILNCASCDSSHYGISCGNTYGLMEDTINGVSYKTVQIGDQIWMAENLKNRCVDHYSAGGNSKNDDIYGYLYTWENAMKACPEGWRLPTKDDFVNLLDHVEKNRTAPSNYWALMIFHADWRYYDEFGFNAQLAGIYFPDYYDNYDRYTGFGRSGLFWSSTEYNDSNAYLLYLNDYYVDAGIDNSYKTDGYSVRCIKD